MPSLSTDPVPMEQEEGQRETVEIVLQERVQESGEKGTDDDEEGREEIMQENKPEADGDILVEEEDMDGRPSDVEILEQAGQKKQEGNAHFSNSHFDQANQSYQDALGLLASATGSDAGRELLINLHSNLAMVAIRQKNYESAVRHCTIVLTDWDDCHVKALFRRAQALEGIGTLSSLTLAVDDLQLQIKLLPKGKDKTRAEQSLKRVQKRMKELSSSETNTTNASAAAAAKKMANKSPTTPGTPPPQQQQRQQPQGRVVTPVSSPNTIVNGSMMNGHHHSENNNDSRAMAVTPSPLSRPSPEQQKHDVLRLLISRACGLQRQQSVAVGEALFLVDWNWWCQWCRYTDFFGANPEQVLKNMPAGAILPPQSSKKRATTSSTAAAAATTSSNDGTDSTDTTQDDSEDDSSNSSSSSSSEEEDDDDSPPGMLDNSALFLLPAASSSTQSKFYQQWYRHFLVQKNDDSNCETDVGDWKDEKGNIPALRPNLVRGFHYEIIPREVWLAFKTWYKAVSPSICRRTKLWEEHPNTPCIDLYPSSGIAPLPVADRPTGKCSACRVRGASKRCTRCMAVFYCNRSCQESHWLLHKHMCSKIAGQQQAPPQQLLLPDGRVGLNNMGNTCFMNSALQCLSHATPLTRHFLSGQHVHDLNPHNPLGTGGKLASAFEVCLKELWWKNQTSTSPTALKRAIAMFAPRFAGCLQHDSQEFLAYLLDGLHEDLNRIREAPYVEMPDFGDDSAGQTAIHGSLAWDCHRRRNDSLVMDTFYGQFKSTCVCPTQGCGKVSVSFDAFNHVSLEIPVQRHQQMVFLSWMVFPKGSITPFAASKYGLCLPRGSYVEDAREQLSELMGVPATHLMICEVDHRDHIISSIYNNEKPIASIRPDECVAVYQAEPYTSSCIHMLCSHSVVEEDDNNGQSLMRENFGWPFASSCDSRLTCRQLWEHVWQLVRHLVVPATEDGRELDEDLDPELEDVYSQMVQIRVTNPEGDSRFIFPRDDFEHAMDQDSETDDAEERDDLFQLTTTPYLPKDLNEELSTFLGDDCTTRFLFLNLEWTESMTVPQELLRKNASASPSSSPSGGSTNNKKKKKAKKITTPPKAKVIPPTISIYEGRFTAFTNHPSHGECVRKKRELEAARGVSLDQCFETFTRPERLDEHNMWYCSNCKEHVRALKTMELWRLPNILVVHLKRFEFRHGFRRDKLMTFVNFPLEGLDMSKHCAQWKAGEDPPEQLFVNNHVPAVYDLFAVVNHYGRMGFGHYTAFARKWDEEELSDDWALFDDSSVRSVGDGRGGGANGVVDGVVTPAAYVLFYRRRTFN